jgi:CheY-like chemotaxis protein
MSQKRITCLLIDDDAEDQEIFSHALAHLNLNVDCVTANDGIHAIDKIKSDPDFNPFFIFIDVNMPKMSGIECLAEIKKISRFKNVPVYLYSTYVDSRTLNSAKDKGAVDVLVKANSMSELKQTLSMILN